MGFIDENGIYVYDETDLFAPVHTALNLLGTCVSEKLVDYDATLPLFYTKTISGAIAVVATSGFTPLEGTTLSVTLPRKALVRVDFNTWATIGTFSSGTVDMRAGVAVSGATVIDPTVGVPDGSGNWGGVPRLRSGSGGLQAQQSSTRLLELNAGLNNFDISAYKSSAAVAMSVSYSYYIVEIIRWLD